MPAKAATAEAPAPKTRKAKAEKPEAPARVGMTTKEAAEKLGITPVRLRRILRTDDFSNDHTYTRYDITDDVFKQLQAAVAAGASGEKRGRKPKKAAPVEDSAEEVAEELAELEDDEEVAELELDDEDEE
jgi:CO/xanthine dehydrogenase Mo-binding subunit